MHQKFGWKLVFYCLAWPSRHYYDSLVMFSSFMCQDRPSLKNCPPLKLSCSSCVINVCFYNCIWRIQTPITRNIGMNDSFLWRFNNLKITHHMWNQTLGQTEKKLLFGFLEKFKLKILQNLFKTKWFGFCEIVLDILPWNQDLCSTVTHLIHPLCNIASMQRH